MLATNLLHERYAPEKYPPRVRDAATLLEMARGENRQIPPLTADMEFQDLNHDDAYDVAAAGYGLRMHQGAVPVGRKIGFTNPNIWDEYSVHEPIWGYMFDTTVQTIDPGDVRVIDLSRLSHLQPRIEPEIVLGLIQPPSPEMDDDQLLSCVGWIAHGFEIVISIFPDWKFSVVDTIAASALHGRLILGPKCSLEHERNTTSGRRKLLKQLESFEIRLFRNGTLQDTGKGANVLGGPIAALRHLAKVLAGQSRHPGLTAGEMISTGTLTGAPLIADGEQWHTELSGINLPGLHVRFKLQ
ncbi:hypothetical protein AYL99_08781 [Fonsecaea erecta]|uniref:Fumarylacetoacetase-like C-terminal domain-containing protein n=1 Tax=Fonsecaea erecta TaxID=1367422 RepID=A0A178ZA72_9EURO|nr:hypothetical protein AYL99_08781 [Fonsecaea erecta]OAP56669.1 hypothetical protein AYL99_08781 [Fonsecaea erecta]